MLDTDIWGGFLGSNAPERIKKCRHLAAEAEITLFLDRFEPANREIRARFRWHNYRRDPAVLQTLAAYDAV